MNYVRTLELGFLVHRAASSGNTRVLKACLEEGLDVDWRPEHELGFFHGTPLHSACKAGQPGCAKLLLQAGANPLARGTYGYTPLHMVSVIAKHGPALVRLLLEAAPSAAQALDSGGHTPLKVGIHFVSPGTLPSVLALLHLAPRQPAAQLLGFLNQSLGEPADVAAVFAAVVMQQPLSPTDWQLVPFPCAGLGAALPAVLRRSEAEAALLVAHLPSDAQQRLRTAALCLARAQRGLWVSLPTPLVHDWLALAVAEPEVEALLKSASFNGTA